MSDLPSAVLFACTMNSVRSPMAEAIMKFLHGHRVFVDSVGVRSGEIDGFAVAVMEEVGIDLTRHHSKTFDELEDDYFDIVIPLSPQAQHRAVEMTRVMAVGIEFWNIFDPAIVESENREVKLSAYRKVRDELMNRIKIRFPIISVNLT